MEIPTFGNQVANESKVPQDVLKRLRDFYPQIKKVRNSQSGATSYAYDFDLSVPDGFWSTPNPTLTNKDKELDAFGSFKNLVAPTISKHWSFSSKPRLEEVDEEEDQEQEEKPPKNMDALAKSVVPGRCSEPMLEAFLSGKPLAEWSNSVPKTSPGRFLEVDENLFQNTKYVRCDTHTLIPSVEYKARLIAKDSFSSLDMLRAQEAKTRPLLENWNSPGVWVPKTGVSKEENGDLTAPEDGSLLADSVSKEDLLNELHNRSDLTNLTISQMDHQSKLIIALHAELKLQMRESFLFNAMPSSSNNTLVEAVRNSRMSVPQLFGPVPNQFRDKVLDYPNVFTPLRPPALVKFSGPIKKKTFRRRPFGSRGGYPSSSQTTQHQAPRGQARRARGPKNPNRGGKAYTSQVLQPATCGAGARGGGRGRGRSRGGKTSRRARGKRQR